MVSPKSRPYPLKQLPLEEPHKARGIILHLHSKSLVSFRTISVEEPPKAELQRFLEIERNGALNTSTTYPKRLSRVAYDVIGSSKIPQYLESLVDVEEGVEISREIGYTAHHASLTLYV